MVLIDEIDKAPRDVPNDLLSEIDDMRFRINEIATVHSREKSQSAPIDMQSNESEGEFKIRASKQDLRPVVVITSNSEKPLPDAFLRRCVYHHVPFPEFDDPEHANSKINGEVTVQTIVASRLLKRYAKGGKSLVDDAIAFFRHLREQPLERKPGLAELLNWLDYLLPNEAKTQIYKNLKAIPELQRLEGMKTTLLKKRTDQEEAEQLLRNWLNDK